MYVLRFPSSLCQRVLVLCWGQGGAIYIHATLPSVSAYTLLHPPPDSCERVARFAKYALGLGSAHDERLRTNSMCTRLTDCAPFVLLCAVWNKLKAEKGVNEFKADAEEECEDSLGNVISKRIYEDLKANGLL